MALAVTSLATASAAPLASSTSFSYLPPVRRFLASGIAAPRYVFRSCLLALEARAEICWKAKGRSSLSQKAKGLVRGVVAASLGGGNREGKAVRFGFQRSSNHR